MLGVTDSKRLGRTWERCHASGGAVAWRCCHSARPPALSCCLPDSGRRGLPLPGAIAETSPFFSNDGRALRTFALASNKPRSSSESKSLLLLCIRNTELYPRVLGSEACRVAMEHPGTPPRATRAPAPRRPPPPPTPEATRRIVSLMPLNAALDFPAFPNPCDCRKSRGCVQKPSATSATQSDGPPALLPSHEQPPVLSRQTIFNSRAPLGRSDRMRLYHKPKCPQRTAMRAQPLPRMGPALGAALCPPSRASSPNTSTTTSVP